MIARRTATSVTTRPSASTSLIALNQLSGELGLVLDVLKWGGLAATTASTAAVVAGHVRARRSGEPISPVSSTATRTALLLAAITLLAFLLKWS